MKPDHIIVKMNVNFWLHPIKWWQARKTRKVMQFIMNQKYRQMEPEIRKMETDLLLYGHAAMRGDKHVKIVPSDRIDYCCECGKEHGYFCPKIGS